MACCLFIRALSSCGTRRLVQKIPPTLNTRHLARAAFACPTSVFPSHYLAFRQLSCNSNSNSKRDKEFWRQYGIDHAKVFWRKYGYVGLTTYFSLYFSVLGGAYVGISSGLMAASPGSSAFLAAWMLTKVSEPFRLAITLAVTPPICRILRYRQTHK